MADAVSVAEDILTLARKRGVSLTAMQLFQLTYLAYGWYLEFENEKLFDDPIQAWDIGPIVPSIFDKFIQHGSNPIPEGRVPRFVQNKSLESFLNDVVDVYSSKPTSSLEEFTTNNGTPWNLVHEKRAIPGDLIWKQFRDLAAKGREQLEDGSVSNG